MVPLLLAAVWTVAPVLPIAWLVAGHLVIGSGRWAHIPPVGLGLPLLTAVSILLALGAHLLSARGKRTNQMKCPIWPLVPLGAAGALLAWSAVSLLWSPSWQYGLD